MNEAGARTTRIDLTAGPSGRPVAHRGPEAIIANGVADDFFAAMIDR